MKQFSISEKKWILKRFWQGITDNTDLEDKSEAYSRTLSGGMRRRLLVAKAMVHKPPILILDEPTAGVDIELRVQLWNYVRKLNENGTTIMMSTHDIGQAKRLAKNILFLNKGKLESTQPAQTFFREPMSNNASKFIAGDIVE